MQRLITILMAFCFFSDFYGTESVLKTELSEKESYDLANFYELNSWEKIEEYHHKKKISFDVILNTDSFCRPLDVAFWRGKYHIISELLNKKKVDVFYKDPRNGYTSLHKLISSCGVRHTEKKCKKNNCFDLFKYLIKKGVDINSFSLNGTPVLYISSLLDGKRDQEKTTLCIENGAKLMVKKGDDHWNFLTLKSLGDLELLLGMEKKLLSFYGTGRRIKNALYTKFKYDYKNYCKAYFTTALVLKKVKSKKNIHIPKILYNCMATFIASDPVEHIEEALVDAWSQQSSLLSDHVDNFEETFKAAYVDLMCHIIPKSWKNGWIDYKGGNRSPFNLVVRALQHAGPKEELNK